MKFRLGAVALLGLLAGFAGAQEETAPAGVSAKGADLELLRAVRSIATRLEQARRQAFERPPIAVRAPDAMREIAADIRALNVITRERLSARGRAWRDIGIGGDATPEVLYKLLATDLAGIGFDPSGNRLLVSPERLSEWDFSPDAGDDEATRVLLATGVRPDEPSVVHLLMHVRQRERRGGDWLLETTDETLAGAAWAEGEANLVALRHLFSGMGLANDVVTSRLDPAEVIGGVLVPPGYSTLSEGVMAVLADFVYREGFAVCAEIFHEGGWEALDRALSASATTRDLMHADQRGVARVAIPAESAPGEGWIPVDSDSLGEQAIFAMLAVATGKDNLGLMAGDGWIGDRLDRWETADGGGITVWRTRWRSAEDAGDFLYGYRRAVEALHPEGRWTSEARIHFEAADRALKVQEDGTAVRIEWGAPGGP